MIHSRLKSFGDELGSFIGENPILVGGGGLAVAAGTAYGISKLSKSRGKSGRARTRKRRARKSGIKHTKRGWKQDRRRRSKQKWEVDYQKRKHKKKNRSKKGIHYTKNGQPYKILSSGKARFIKRR